MTKHKLDTEIELNDPRYCNGCPLLYKWGAPLCVHNEAILKIEKEFEPFTLNIIRDKDCPLSVVDEYAEAEKESLKEYERFTE